MEVVVGSPSWGEWGWWAERRAGRRVAHPSALSISVGRLRVKTGVDERHLLEYKGEHIMCWGERALLRAMVSGASMRVGRGVVGASFGCMATDEKRQASVRTTSRTCA
jgi:hypothetical protein